MAAQTRQLTVGERFDLKRVLDGTQDFRWCRRADGWYSGVLTGHLVHIRQAGGQLEYRANTDLAALLRPYFRLDENIEAIHAELAAVDAGMAELVKSHSYLRVLRQPDPWQAAVSYICSATNRIERITKSVENIACELGDCRELDGDIRRTFPAAQKVLEAGEARLEELTVGLKSFPKRIVRTASRVVDRSLDLEHLAKPDVCYAEARLQLMASPGIGAKVADCIALFALEKPKHSLLILMFARHCSAGTRTPLLDPPREKPLPCGPERSSGRTLATPVNFCFWSSARRRKARLFS